MRLPRNSRDISRDTACATFPTTQVLRPFSFRQHWSGFMQTHSSFETTVSSDAHVTWDKASQSPSHTLQVLFTGEPAVQQMHPWTSTAKLPMEERNVMGLHATCGHMVYCWQHRLSTAGIWWQHCQQGDSTPSPALRPCCRRTTEEETSSCWPGEG